MTNTESWDRIASQRSGSPPTDIVHYGPGGPTEDDVRLLGDVRGKRILDLGCGDGQAAVAFALRGATTIAVDASVRMLDRARTLGEQAAVRVEWHQGDVADLAFLRAESVDIVFSAYSMGEVGDLHRVFRQVAPRPQEPAVRSCSPTSIRSACASAASRRTHRRLRSAGSCACRTSPTTPSRSSATARPIRLHVRTVSEVFCALTRGGFRIEVLAEPRPPGADALVPHTIIWRGPQGRALSRAQPAGSMPRCARPRGQSLVRLVLAHRALVEAELEEVVEGLADDRPGLDAEERHHLPAVEGRPDAIQLFLLARAPRCAPRARRCAGSAPAPSPCSAWCSPDGRDG